MSTTKIECLTTFLDGITKYYAGDTRTVPTDIATYFIEQGWAKLLEGDTPDGFNGSVDLNVHNVLNSQETRING